MNASVRFNLLLHMLSRTHCVKCAVDATEKLRRYVVSGEPPDLTCTADAAQPVADLTDGGPDDEELPGEDADDGPSGRYIDEDTGERLATTFGDGDGKVGSILLATIPSNKMHEG